MIDPANYVLFIAASWALIITPGPDTIYVITRGISHGRRAGILSIFGLTTGLMVHTTLAALGLAVLFQTSDVAFWVVQYAGAAYLVYLGIKAFRDDSSFKLTEQKTVDYRTVFWQGFLTNLLNPKVALFFMAFLPQFVDPRMGHVGLQMVMLGVTFAVFGVSFMLVVAYFAGSIGNWLAGQQRFTHGLRWLTGSVFIALGVRLALIDR